MFACRAGATNRAAASTSSENGDGANGIFKRPKSRALFCTLKFAKKLLCKNFSNAKLYEIENESFFTHFLRVNRRHRSEWISLKISPDVTPRLGIMPPKNETGATS